MKVKIPMPNFIQHVFIMHRAGEGLTMQTRETNKNFNEVYSGCGGRQAFRFPKWQAKTGGNKQQPTRSTREHSNSHSGGKDNLATRKREGRQVLKNTEGKGTATHLSTVRNLGKWGKKRQDIAKIKQETQWKSVYNNKIPQVTWLTQNHRCEPYIGASQVITKNRFYFGNDECLDLHLFYVDMTHAKI